VSQQGWECIIWESPWIIRISMNGLKECVSGSATVAQQLIIIPITTKFATHEVSLWLITISTACVVCTYLLVLTTCTLCNTSNLIKFLDLFRNLCHKVVSHFFQPDIFAISNGKDCVISNWCVYVFTTVCANF